MNRRSVSGLLVLAMFFTAVPNAYASLERVGPINPSTSVGKFPAWYQDKSGLTLEFCDPKTQAEVDGGWCLLLPPDVTSPPEIFPLKFFDEHFYFAAGANLAPPSGAKALLVLALESAFSTGFVQDGAQQTFARIRMKLDPVPAAGTYRFIHPYGEETFDVAAGDRRIFFTDDVGINCAPGVFDCALESRLGPFLLPSASGLPGGPEAAAVTGPGGQLYLADPGFLGPVTGSPLPNFIDSTGASRNHNIFRIEGPAGSNLGGPGIDSIETTSFTLMGRVFTGTIAGRVNVDRASYTRNGTTKKLDVFASGFETIPARIPPLPRPPRRCPS